MVIEKKNANRLASDSLFDDLEDKLDEILNEGPGGGSGGGNSGGSNNPGSGNTPPPETQPPAPAPEPEPSPESGSAPEMPETNPPSSEEPPYEGDTGASDDSGDSGGDQGGSAPQPEDSNQDGGYFIGELTDDPDPEETDIMDVLETGAPGEGTMVLTGRKKVEQEPVTEQPEPPPSPELVENYWLKGGLLVAIAIIICLLFQNPRRKKS